MVERTPADLNLQQLRIFLVLGQELHFGRAADRLLLTQPYVSRTLASLERRIGGRLLDRTSRQVRLTPLGRSFHAELTKTYDELARTVQRARDSAAGLRETLVVGCTTTTASSALTCLVRDFETSRPQYQVWLHELPLYLPYRALADGTVDVLVCWLPDETDKWWFRDESGHMVLDETYNFAYGPVIEEHPTVLVMRAGHPLARRESVSPEELADYGMPDFAGTGPWPASVLRVLWPSETPAGRPIPRVGSRCRSMSEVIDSLARCDAVKPTIVAVARAHAHRGDLAFVQIDGEPTVRLGPMWMKGRASNAVTAFVEVATKIASDSTRIALPDSGEEEPSLTIAHPVATR